MNKEGNGGSAPEVKQATQSSAEKAVTASGSNHNAAACSGQICSDCGDLIASLPLFSGLCSESRNNLLRHARVLDFAKGSLLFLEGTPANRLYLVLEGWIKIAKNTEDGKETILQMLGAGDMVLASTVFLNGSFPYIGEIAEHARVLSIPALDLRAQIKQDEQLAGNFLTLMAKRSHNLVREIEDSRLKTAEERIGFFLLRHFLDQGRGSCRIELPYDKSLIAAQLNMRRETFSRVLQRMKRRGFAIDKHAVVMPDFQALCGFCDQDTADHCKMHGKPDCPHPHCSRR